MEPSGHEPNGLVVPLRPLSPPLADFAGPDEFRQRRLDAFELWRRARRDGVSADQVRRDPTVRSELVEVTDLLVVDDSTWELVTWMLDNSERTARER